MSSGDQPGGPARGDEPSDGDATRRLDPADTRPTRRGDSQPATRPPRRRGAIFAAGVVGLLLGFVVAFVVVALGTGGDEDAEVAAAEERIVELEAELDARDARMAELEARLAEAEAAAGERDEDVATQREALDERARLLDEREAALTERSAALDEREQAVARAEDDPSIEIDEETQGVIDQVVDQIRELFD